MKWGINLQFNHFSVMLNECIEGLNIKENGIYVDCTLGGGGHSLEILKRLKDGKLIAIDQDEYSIKYCKEKFKNNSNVIFVKDNFKNIKEILEDLNINKVDGILMDLGVSSYQIDTCERGFSYMKNWELDMRMDTGASLKAKDVINNYSEEELYYIFKTYGEEKYSKKIAYKIVMERKIKPIETTFDLVKLIDEVIPKFEIKKRGHLSKKVFQALRIEVNNELNILENTVKNAVEKLNVDGRLAVITFHSLEDRIIKNTFNYLALECICPKEFPICKCSKKKEIKIINKKPILPTAFELENNSRSNSAKLRICEKNNISK